MNKTFKKLGFKGGDKVKCVESNYITYEVGKVYTLEDYYSSDKTYHAVLIEDRWNGSFATWEKVEDMFEDQWHLNDGKVSIPDDADKLEKDGSVVAFRKRKVKDLEFGDELFGYITGTKYRFIRYTNHLKTHCDALNSENMIATSQKLGEQLIRK